MLTQLTIRNYGLIDEISIEFLKGFNILTGETGAGKSILIDALRSALGERLDTASIRNPQNPCVIETVFDISDKKLRELELIREFLNEDDHSSSSSAPKPPQHQVKSKSTVFQLLSAS